MSDRHARRAHRMQHVVIAAAIAMGTLVASPIVLGHAVSGRVITLHQPDGSPVTLRAWGDEFGTILESLDGYTVTRDPAAGTLCYARLSADGTSLASTGLAVGTVRPADMGLAAHLRPAREGSRIQRAAARRSRASSRSVSLASGVYGPATPTRTGAIKGVCVLVDFPDSKGEIPPAEVNRLLNQAGYNGYGNNGSVRDYFYDVSHGRLTLTHHVPTSYYTAPYNKSYYESGNFERVDTLVTQALTSLDTAGLDFSQFDSNNDGYIDSIICIYAGSGDGGLWPHGGQGTAFAADNVRGWNNIVVGTGGSLELQTLCHELGHSVCEWPDLYDGDGVGDGVGFYCLMGISLNTNDTNPPRPCAVLRDMAGWSDTQKLSGTREGLTLAADGNVVYKYARPGNPSEYFMIENRQQAGRDANLFSEGLAIWHVDQAKDDNDQQQGTASLHYMVSLEQADGQRHLEQGDTFADGNDFYGGAGAVFSADSNPNSNWWGGTDSSVRIDNISDSGPTMTFTFTSDDLPPGTSTPGTQPEPRRMCGVGAAEMFPVVVLQLLALKAWTRSRRHT